jgi:tetratricopeptide (TPR) repeat protein
MEKINNYFLVLKNLESQESFVDLDLFSFVSVENMNAKEKNFLSHLLVSQAQELLKINPDKAFDVIEKAISICPLHPEMHYQLGAVLFEAGKRLSSVNFLMIASEKFKVALNLDPLFVLAAEKLGLCLAWIGYKTGESNYFEEAFKTFENMQSTAIALSGSYPFDFYWSWALVHYLQGTYFGEVVDFKLSLEKFQKALEFDKGSAPFWTEYAHSILAMAFLISSHELLTKASTLYETAIKLNPLDSNAHFCLGAAYHELFEMEAKEEYYTKAYQAYQVAESLKDDLNIKHKFGQLLLSYGKLCHDQEVVESAIEKFSFCDNNDRLNPLFCSSQAEALMLLGVYREDLSLLNQAKEKIVVALEVSPELIEIWLAYGQCLFEMGKYFQDENYFRQAVQKFEYGLTLNDTKPSLWYGLSRAVFAIAELKKDEQAATWAIECANKACSFRKSLPLYWSNWAVCLLLMGEISQHRHYIESAIEKLENSMALMERDDDNFLYLETLYHYGYALDFLADFDLDSQGYEKAIDVLKLVIEKEPSYNQARYALASALVHVGELNDDAESLQEAFMHLERLFDEDSEDLVVIADMGVVLLNLAYLSKDTGRPHIEEYFLEKAEEKFSLSASLGGCHSYYYLACLYSMRHRYDVAMHFIEKAENFDVLPSLDDLMHDQWLEGLRNTEVFNNFIQRLKTKQISEP